MAQSGLLAFCTTLENTALNEAIQNYFWIVPTMQSLHILAVAAVLIATLLIDLRMLGLHGKNEPIATAVNRYSHLIWIALPVLLITGCIMIVGEPVRSLTNPAFQLKMVMLIAVVVITLGLQKKWHGNMSHHANASTRLLAILSLGLWAGIVAAGRWIAYA